MGLWLGSEDPVLHSKWKSLCLLDNHTRLAAPPGLYGRP